MSHFLKYLVQHSMYLLNLSAYIFILEKNIRFIFFKYLPSSAFSFLSFWDPCWLMLTFWFLFPYFLTISQPILFLFIVLTQCLDHCFWYFYCMLLIIQWVIYFNKIFSLLPFFLLHYSLILLHVSNVLISLKNVQ